MKKIIQLKDKEFETSQSSSHCSFCDAEDGKLRLVGRYIVSLKDIELHGEKKRACQGCYQGVKNEINKRDKAKEEMNSSWLIKWRRKLFLSSTLLIGMILICSEVIAQPMLPSAPDQAPIDGGLSLLAAAGGAYAWKKLRGKKE